MPLRVLSTPANIVAVSTPDWQQIFYRLLPKVVFKTSSGDVEKEFNPKQRQFIKEILVPPFLQLKQNKELSGIYEMLMKKFPSDFKIIVYDYESEIFSVDPKGAGNKSVAVAQDVHPDKIVIHINNYDKFSPTDMRQKIYHELMHALLNVSCKDGDNENEKKTLIQCRDYESLTAKSEKYLQNLMEALALFNAWRETKGPNASREEVINMYLAACDSKGCWAVRRPDNNEDLEYYLNHSAAGIYDADEIIAWGLTFYFGSNDDRERLKKQDFETYIDIEYFIVPMIKKSAEKGPLSEAQIKELELEAILKLKKLLKGCK